MYAVAVGPCSGARCENRATLWRVRVPAAEKIMSQHYASDSVPSLTESVLLEILYQLREGRSLNLSTKPKVTHSWKLIFNIEHVSISLRISDQRSPPNFIPTSYRYHSFTHRMILHNSQREFTSNTHPPFFLSSSRIDRNQNMNIVEGDKNYYYQ